MANSTTYLKTYFAEKALTQRVYEVEAKGGTTNLIMTSEVIYTLLNASDEHQRKAADIIRKLDLKNGDIHHFLEFIAKSMAFDLGDMA